MKKPNQLLLRILPSAPPSLPRRITHPNLQTHPDLPKGKEQVTIPIISANELQPPPSLPRRGGTDTIGYMIVVISHLIINGLSTAIVTVPPLRGRLGGG